MTTIHDIAKRSGVSVGTVSNVINNRLSVKDQTRRRVRRAISALNYNPNRVAKSLASGRTQTLAFIVPDICNPFFPEMVRGAIDTANLHGYELFLANIDNDPRKEIQYIENFIARGVDGLIIVTSDCSSEQVDQITRLNTQVVIVDREIKDLHRDLVIVDNHACGYQAAQHLLAGGSEPIGMIMGPLQTSTAQQRLKGARAALAARKRFDPDLVVSGTYTFESGFKLMQALLQDPKRVGGVLCANDMIAIGAIKAIQNAGRKVPQDVSVIGIDDIMLSRLVDPPLTTVRQPTFELGAVATRMILERIEGRTTGVPRKVILPGELVVRHSTRQPLGPPGERQVVATDAVTAPETVPSADAVAPR
jgi:LacI family transcriptional regulator